MDLGKYITRINYTGELRPNITVLRGLQKNHLLHIAFENLDIHNKVPIRLDIHNIFEKIIQNNRGGFCYELNGLFYEMLVSVGFNASRISARTHQKDNTYSPEFDHLAICVKIDEEEYLTDVGFGEFAFEPLKLELGFIQHDQRGDFMIDRYDHEYYRVSKMVNGEPAPEYIFTKMARELNDFTEMCTYHQTNPASHFMKNRLVSLPTDNGRITISGDNLKIKENDSIMERTLKTEDEFEKELWDLFKMKI